MKRNKITPTRECLDQYVFDYGEDAAQAYYGLTEAKYNSIMYDKITTKLPERFRYVEPTEDVEVPELSPDFNELKNYICTHFKSILDKHKANNSTNIDARAMSPYDRAMEVLTDLLYYNSDYIYSGDRATGEYIEDRLSNGTAMERMKACREYRPIQLNDDMEVEYEDHSAEDVSNVMGRLSSKQFQVADLLNQGYSQTEIAEKLGIRIQSVNDRISVARKKLKELT